MRALEKVRESKQVSEKDIRKGIGKSILKSVSGKGNRKVKLKENTGVNKLHPSQAHVYLRLLNTPMAEHCLSVE